MRTIIAGGRNFADPQLLAAVMAALPFRPTVVLSGGAQGADRLGELWADSQGITIEHYPADWGKHGKNEAGKIRNALMAQEGRALVAFWDGMSGGTANMIANMVRLSKRAFVVDFKPVVIGYTGGT